MAEMRRSVENVVDFHKVEKIPMTQILKDQLRQPLPKLGFSFSAYSIRKITNGLSFINYPALTEIQTTTKQGKWRRQMKRHRNSPSPFPPGKVVISCLSLQWGASPMKISLFGKFRASDMYDDIQKHLMQGSLDLVRRLNDEMRGLSLADLGLMSGRVRQPSHSGVRVNPCFILKATVQKRRRSSSTMGRACAKRAKMDG